MTAEPLLLATGVYANDPVAAGLVMSAIKRDKGVKDWGHTIAGHGGFIDRLDSVVFAAPIFFHVTRYVWNVG